MPHSNGDLLEVEQFDSWLIVCQDSGVKLVDEVGGQFDWN